MVAVAVRQRMLRLRDDGFLKVREGLTSIAEMERMDEQPALAGFSRP